MTETPAPGAPPSQRSNGIKKVSYSHDAMIDLIIQEPTVTKAELGELFGYSAGWVGRVIASDSFQARLAERKACLVDPHIAQSLNERLSGVVIQAVEVVSSKLAAEQSAAYAMDALGVASKALGMGQLSRRGV